MYILIVLYMGEIEFTKICIDDDMAQLELADWCRDNWHDEDSNPANFFPGDLIEWYFDHYEDYAYYRQPIQVPSNKPVAMTQGEDIILTPGMCAIIRNGLSRVDFGFAHDLLEEHDELDEEDGAEAGVKLIGDLIDRFE